MSKSKGFSERARLLTAPLINMHAKCGAFTKLQPVLQELPVSDVDAWNVLIAEYAQRGQGEEALKCFHSMQHQGHSPDAVTFTYALKACGAIRAAAKGEEIHNKIVCLGMFEKNIGLGSALVDMYVRCGALTKAQEVLEGLCIRNAVMWNAVIAGYAHQGQGEQALNCFDSMQYEGHSPDVFTFTCALKACGSIRAVTKGKQIHHKIVRLGMLEKDIILATALVDMYAKCGALAKAQQVLDGLPVRDVVVWSTLIVGFTMQGQGEEALKCFDSMQCEGHLPDVVTFTCALKACGSIRAAAKGEQIHNEIVRLGLLEKNIVLGSTLVDMYAKCDELAKAQQVLQGLFSRNVVAWSALIAGYAQQGQGEEALKCFDSMECEGHSPDAIVFTSALKACGSVRAVGKGKEIHDKIVSLGMLEKHVVLGSTLVDMYARCGELVEAQRVLEGLPLRDVVMWSTLVAGYTQQGQGEEALKCFDSMQDDGYFPDLVTFSCALKACGSIGAADKGNQIHEKIISLGMLKKDVVLVSALVDMYSRCGLLLKAREVFNELPVQNVVSWNALIGGYAQQGQSLEAFDCFRKMQYKGVKPNSVTLICMLNAYGHSGQFDQIEMLFLKINAKYGITPEVEHYSCMVDLFACARKFKRALSVIEMMPSAEHISVWAALLGACYKWGVVKIGRLGFNRLIHLDKRNAAVYICMSRIYTAGGMQGDAENIEAIRVANRAWKVPGRFWETDMTGKVHVN